MARFITGLARFLFYPTIMSLTAGGLLPSTIVEGAESAEQKIAAAVNSELFEQLDWNDVKNITELKENETKDLAVILKKILNRLKTINASYNFFLHYAPDKEDLHFHIEVTPRLATWAGFEFSTNATINSVTPEEAAEIVINANPGID